MAAAFERRMSVSPCELRAVPCMKKGPAQSRAFFDSRCQADVRRAVRCALCCWRICIRSSGVSLPSRLASAVSKCRSARVGHFLQRHAAIAVGIGSLEHPSVHAHSNSGTVEPHHLHSGFPVLAAKLGRPIAVAHHEHPPLMGLRRRRQILLAADRAVLVGVEPVEHRAAVRLVDGEALGDGVANVADASCRPSPIRPPRESRNRPCCRRAWRTSRGREPRLRHASRSSSAGDGRTCERGAPARPERYLARRQAEAAAPAARQPKQRRELRQRCRAKAWSFSMPSLLVGAGLSKAKLYVA